MRAIVQRVSRAAVEIDGGIVGRIETGLLVYLGVEAGDTHSDPDYIAEKIVGLRIFEDAAGKMNLDVRQAEGKVLAIPAFTLLADARKGRRPSFELAAEPQLAEKLYHAFVDKLRSAGLQVETGKFRQTMQIDSQNAGPVCILLDSRKRF